jgi:Cu-Zn family superoxide dismutase
VKRIFPASPVLILASLALSAGLTACAVAFHAPRTVVKGLPIALFDSEGRSIGNVTLTADSAGMDLAFEVHDLPPGTHGVHVHAVGRCERPDFLTAGGHLDDGAHHHGRDNADGWHLGDLPNLEVGLDGSARVTLRLVPQGTKFELKRLLDSDGSAVIIHAGPDDGHTDPSGGSGSRIGCGIIA